MADSTHPTMSDITLTLARLADRVATDPSPRLDPFVSNSMRRLMQALRRFIPGLDTPPDLAASIRLTKAAYAAMEDNDKRTALSQALRGLSFSPHHPRLFYVAATSCFEYGAIEDGIRLLCHTLWIHGGHAAARRDLEALAGYIQERWPGSVLAGDPPLIDHVHLFEEVLGMGDAARSAGEHIEDEEV